VNVTTNYTGANAETSVKAVVTTLERAINGVPGMQYMTSVSGNDGESIIQIIFKPGVDPDLAAVNVQNRVSTTLDELPEEVTKAGVAVEKVQNSMLLYINVLSTDTTYDEKFLYNFADINILKEIKRIEGVGFADILGVREYAMRVWLKPDRMRFYGIDANEVLTKLRQQNVEAAPGKIGESSGKRSRTLQYVLRYTGKFNTPEEYRNIVVRASGEGELVRLKDIADVEFDSQGLQRAEQGERPAFCCDHAETTPGHQRKEGHRRHQGYHGAHPGHRIPAGHDLHLQLRCEPVPRRLHKQRALDPARSLLPSGARGLHLPAGPA
jgi:HAE1 family hydrophobic/amphiphilic exporter-1